MKTKNIILVVVAVLLCVGALFFYKAKMDSTKIALVNYPNFLYSKLAISSKGTHCDVFNIDQNDIDNLDNYDMAIFFGMGLKLSEEQVAKVQAMGEKGLPIYLGASTTKGLELTNLDSVTTEQVDDYLGNGGTLNYKNLFSYIRANIDDKIINVPDSVETPKDIPSDVLFYTDESVSFEGIKEFENYCLKEKHHKDGNKKVIIMTSIMGPFSVDREHFNSLINELQNRNLNVYPVAGFGGRLKFMQEIDPDLIVYMPHGRLSLGGGNADTIVDWLKKQNVPLLCPLTVHQQYDEWLEDKQGMLGGLLSQSVTMPEFDGGIAPYAVFAETLTKEGYVVFKAIPNRLKKFGDMVEKYIALKKIENKDKKIAIVYFKGPGKNSLIAADMEVLPSMFNVLNQMKQDGYNLGNLPEKYEDFKNDINSQGVVLGAYAKGAFDSYIESGNPELIPTEKYNEWCKELLPKKIIAEVDDKYGKAPGSYMNYYKDGKEYIAVARVKYGNVVLVPQPMPAEGDEHFALVHGANVAPPHSYIAPYFWIQEGFKADAMAHFGTHGSLEFTPGKQIALSDYDWTDPLIGSVPHSYIYTISNIGEAMIAKRRSYAATVTHLTPPFIEAQAAHDYRDLVNNSDSYETAKGAVKTEYALAVKKELVKRGMHKELGLDSLVETPYSDEQMKRIENYLAELNDEKITGGLYTIGKVYDNDKLNETVKMIYCDAIALNMAEFDILNGTLKRDDLKTKSLYDSKYLNKSKAAIDKLLQGASAESIAKSLLKDSDVARVQAYKTKQRTQLAEMMRAKHAENADAKKAGHEHQGHPSGMPKVKKQENGETKSMLKSAMKSGTTPDAMTGASRKIEAPKDSVEEPYLQAYNAFYSSVNDILTKRKELVESPDLEIKGLLDAFAGGFVNPNSGGDPIANPESVPTGNNVFSINAEQTPTKAAWEVGKKLGDEILADYKSKNNGEYPKKISFSLWAGSFIESEGTTIAQILYMLGVEPVWTPRGKMDNIRLIDSKDLGRPRIDVVVQTSGQVRDLAASRLFIINRAVKMAAEAKDEVNFVSSGIADAEKMLIDKGFSPKQARDMSSGRVFGGVNGNYGTGIMGMVEKGDAWDSTEQVAKTYINNMSAVYGDENNWGEFSKGMFEAALLNTEVVVQPRQSNTWGALSLDHVYEFMGGLNIAIRHVTGNDATSYFNDFRNSNNPKIQTLEEAIGIESRTTLLNDRYINEMMKGEATSADVFAETFRNVFGWNVMKPSVIDDRLWDDLYDTYVMDKKNLAIREFFERENPYSLQEMSAIMLETVRKGMWDASPEQIKNMTELHAELVKDHEAGCSGFVCDNAKLRDFISENLQDEQKTAYNEQIDKALKFNSSSEQEAVVLKSDDKSKKQANNIDKDFSLEINKNLIFSIVGLLILLLTMLYFKKRKK